MLRCFKQLGLALLAALALALPTFAQNPARPNIVLIMADDLGYGTLACYGNTAIKTPHIDALAERGVRLTDYHSNGALCSPTRAALLTGRYQQRCVEAPDAELSEVFRAQRQKNPVQRWAWGISPAEVTLPALLRQAGYRTALIGKWHLGYDAKFHPLNYGFDEFRGFVGGAVDNHTHIATHGTQELDWWNGRKIANETGYATDLLTGYATDFIARHKDAPFFLYLAHGAPHDPWQGRDALKKQTPAETYKEVIGALDDSVGAVVAALRQQKLESKTLVIFCSDNGPAAPRGFEDGSRLRGKKNTLYEGGHRVPFIAAWPGQIAAATQSDEAMMSMDLLPTLAKIAGAPLPAQRKFDGLDIQPLLKGARTETPRVLHWQSGDDWALRRGAWKLIGRRENAHTLVNLRSDISETENLLEREPKLAEELLKTHAAWANSFKLSQ